MSRFGITKWLKLNYQIIRAYTADKKSTIHTIYKVYGSLLLYNSLPQTLWLKTTLIYHLTVTVGQEFGHSLAESSGSRSLTRLSIKISLGAAVTSRLNSGRISFLGGCWIKASVPNELFGQRLFSVFFFFLPDVLLSVR